MADYSIFAELGLDSKGFEKGVKKAQSSLNNFSSGIKTVTKTLGSLFAIGSIAQFTKEIGKMASSFNDARAEIVKGTGATGQALEQLSQSVTDALRNGVGLSAQEIGGMVADLNTRFGVMGDELTGLVDKFDMFSSVTGTDTRNAINSVADVMSKWGVETEQTGILLDQLTVASQESGASVEELEAGLKSGQAIFSQFGMSVTQSTAFLATLKKNGIDTSQALTGMRTALAKFSQEGRNAKTAFRETSESIKNAKTETEALQIATEIFGTRSGAEMVRVLRSGSISADEMASKLMNASGALRETDEASRTVKDALDDLKARFTALFSAFSGDNTLRDFIDDIGNSIAEINLEKVQAGMRTFVNTLVNIANNIGGIIKTIYENFKELFSVIPNTLNDNVTIFELWKDNLYSIFDNLYRIVQDVFGLIKAILQGDWEVAWQYAKLAVMRAVSVILDNISAVANTFPNLINAMISGLNKLIDGINKVREFFGQDLIENLGEFTSVDLVDKTGLGNAISDTERKIEELTGKSADIQIKALDNVSTKRKEIVKETKEGEIDIQGAVAETSEGITETEKEEAEKRKEIFKAMLSAMASNIKEWGKKAVETFKKVVSNIGKVLSGIGKVFKNLFSFNIDDALNTLLTFEDSVLTFFVETLPRLPQFFESAISSIIHLVQSILTSIDFEQVADILKSIINSIGNLITSIASYINQNAGKLINGLTTLVKTVIQGVADWVTSGGWRELLKAVLVIQKTIETAIADNMQELVNTIASMLPALIEFLVDSIVSASKTLGKIAKALMPLIAQLINAIIDVITSDEVIEASIEAIEGLVEGLVPAIVDLLVKALPKIINFFLFKLPSYTPKLVVGIVKGLIKGFANVNWGDVVYEIFNGFIEAVKDLFGIHSPSTLFESFGKFMIEGLWQGISNMGSWLWENVNGFFSNLWEGIQNVFSGVGDWFSSTFSGAVDGIKNAFSGIGNWFSNLWDNIKNGASDIGNTVKDAIEGIGDWGSNVGDNVSEGLENLGEKIWDWGSGVGEGISNGLERAGEAIWDFGSGVGEGIRDGLENFGEGVSDFFEGVGDGISDFFEGFGWWATGTNNAPSGLAVVGEAGPELVRFNGGEQVLNTRNTQKALEGMGRSSNTFNVNFTNVKDTSAYALVSQLKQYNRTMAINGIL